MQPRRALQGAEGGRPRGGGRVPVRHTDRQGPEAVHRPRNRPAPRRDAPPLPTPGREAGPGRPPEADLRHRHPRGRGERPHPDRAVHPALQVRRGVDPATRQPGIRPDRRAGRATGLRRRGPRVGPGTGALDRKPAGRGQGGRRPRQAEKAGEEEAPGTGLRPLERGDVRPAGLRGARATHVLVRSLPPDGAQRAVPSRGRPPGPQAPPAGQPRAPRPPAPPRP